MFNTTQLLTIAGVPVARQHDVMDSLTLANERAKGLLFQKIKTRYLLADRLSKLLEWEDDRLCVKYPELIDHDVAPMLNIRLCGDNGPGTPGGSQPLSNCWLDRDPASDAMALTIQKFDTWLTRHLDKVATQKRYDGRVTCALRAGYPGPFQAEGIAFALWMDTCNYQAYQLMSAVLAGTKELPSSEEAFLSEFPQMVWPEPS